MVIGKESVGARVGLVMLTCAAAVRWDAASVPSSSERKNTRRNLTENILHNS